MKEIIVKNSHTYTGRPESIASALTKSGGRHDTFATGVGGPGRTASAERPTLHYVIRTVFCEEAVEDNRLIGCYWSANVVHTTRGRSLRPEILGWWFDNGNSERTCLSG